MHAAVNTIGNEGFRIDITVPRTKKLNLFDDEQGVQVVAKRLDQ